MSKPTYQIGIRTKKKMNKEVRLANIQSTLSIKEKPARVKTLLTKIGKKREKIPSKRTDPKSMKHPESTPHIIHIEGERWIKTLNRQTKARKVVQKRQALKRQKRS